MTGRLAATIASGPFAAGQHEAQLDGSSLAAGIYWIRLQAGARAVFAKSVLLK